MKAIEITDVGPIVELPIPVPEGGGVVVLHGDNGAGKTIALQCVGAVLGSGERLSVRDAQPRGSVETSGLGTGVRITVGRSTRRTGELEATTLEGQFDVAEIVDPGIADPAAADLRRIKALLRMRGLKIASSVFYDLVGGKEAFDGIVSARSTEGTEPVEMAARVKRDFEAAARKRAERADMALKEVAALRAGYEDMDLSVPHDEAELQEELEAALIDRAAADALSEAVADQRTAAAKARDDLGDAEESYEGPISTESKVVYDAAHGAIAVLEKALDDLREQTRQAAADLEVAKVTREMRMRAHANAVAHERAIAGWNKTIQAAEKASANPEALDADYREASERAETARKAIEIGVLVRKAVEHKEQSEFAAARAKQHQQDSDKFRSAAHGVDDVLSELVACASLTVKPGGRLFTPTTRGETLFGELSEGERWKLALDWATDAVGEGGLLWASQEAWQGLDHDNRRLIAERVRESQVVMITAEADEGELRAETFQP